MCLSRWLNLKRVVDIGYVVYGEILRELITTKRYFLEAISGLVMVYILFMGFFFAGQGFTSHGTLPPLDRTDLAHRTVGFILWLFALNSVGHFSNAIRDESHIGIMEQVALSPCGLIVDMCGRAVGKTIIDTVMIGLVLVTIIVTTRISLSFPVVSVGFVFILTLVGLYGLGFFFGGLALIYKRLGSITIVVRFAFLILTGAITPIENFPKWLQVLCKTLPMTEGLKILRLLMVEGKPFWSVVRSGEIGLLIVNSAIYMIVGLMSFKYFENVARDRGLLGVY